MRTVAIKRLHPQFAKDADFVKMFLDEARLAARIRHPNVVQTLDMVATEDELLLVMDYVHGQSLAQLLRACAEPPDPAVVATIVHGVLLGLHAAHTATSERGEPLGIVHRDVSPQNILVGSDGVARVVDFGIAKATDRLQTTREGQVKGKLAYMPPEQLLAEEVTARSDIYSAAVVLWEALALRRMHSASFGPGALVNRILNEDVPCPSSIVPSVPAALDAIVMRGLERDPARRYESAAQMASALEGAVGLVSPTRISDWVASLAGDDLTARSKSLARAESSSTESAGDPLAEKEGVSVTSMCAPAETPLSQRSSGSVETRKRGTNRRRAVWLAALGVGALIGAGRWGWTALRSGISDALPPPSTSAEVPVPTSAVSVATTEPGPETLAQPPTDRISDDATVRAKVSPSGTTSGSKKPIGPRNRKQATSSNPKTIPDDGIMDVRK
jgi:serine/threonine-protein kinase